MSTYPEGCWICTGKHVTHVLLLCTARLSTKDHLQVSKDRQKPFLLIAQYETRSDRGIAKEEEINNNSDDIRHIWMEQTNNQSVLETQDVFNYLNCYG